MKRNSLVTGIVLSTAVSAVLTGCGSIDSLVEDIKDDIVAEIKQSSIRGKAVDGYLQNAVVCLDLNQDGYCQATSEPLTTTLDDGSFTLAVSETHRAHENFDEALLLVFGGVDVDTGKDFRGKLYAPNDGSDLLNVSPITTLVAKKLEKELKADRKLTREQIKERIKDAREKVADVLEIDEDQIGLDPVAFKKVNKDDKLIRKALQVQKSIEALMFAAGVEESERKDKIEDVYEALAEGLDDLGGEKGLDKLFEKAAEKQQFKEMFQEQNHDSLLALTDEITRNIDTAFEGFDQDDDQLEKIGAITEDVFTQIEDNSGDISGIVYLKDNDDRFKDTFDWDRKYIAGDLMRVGMENPSDALVNGIIALFHGHEKIRPGILFIKKERLRDAESEELRKLYFMIKNFEAELKEEKEKEEADKDSQIVQIQAPMSIYIPEHDGYEKVTFNTDNTLSFEEYEVQEDGTFVLENDEDKGENRGFVYSNGAWNQEQEDRENYTIDASGAIILPDMNEKAYLVNEKDISGLTRGLPNFGMDVQMPDGAKMSFVKIEKMDDTYSLYEPVRDYSTEDQLPYASISDFIETQCQNSWFMGDEHGGLAFKGTVDESGNYVCDGTATSGELVVATSYSFEPDFIPTEQIAGKWEIKTLDGGTDVLVVKPYDIKRFEDHDDEVRYPIFAMNGSMLYRGDFEQKGAKHTFPVFNEIAINAIAKSVTENWSDIKNDFDAEFDFEAGGDEPIVRDAINEM